MNLQPYHIMKNSQKHPLKDALQTALLIRHEHAFKTLRHTFPTLQITEITR